MSEGSTFEDSQRQSFTSQRLYSSYADYNSQRIHSNPHVSIIQPRDRSHTAQSPASVWNGISPTRSSFEPTTPANDLMTNLDGQFKALGFNENSRRPSNDAIFRAGHVDNQPRQDQIFAIKNTRPQEYANPYSKEAYESRRDQTYKPSTFRSNSSNPLFTDSYTTSHFTSLNDHPKAATCSNDRQPLMEQPLLRSRNYSSSDSYSYFPELDKPKKSEAMPRPLSAFESRLFDPHARSSSAYDHAFKFDKIDEQNLHPIGFEGTLRRSRTISSPATHFK